VSGAPICSPQQSVICLASDPDELEVRSAIVLHQDPRLLPPNALEPARAEAEESGEPFAGLPEFVVLTFAFSEDDRVALYMDGDRKCLVYGVEVADSLSDAERHAREWVGAGSVELPFRHLPGVYQAAFIEYVTGADLPPHESEFAWVLPTAGGEGEHMPFREFPPRTGPTDFTPDPKVVSFGLLPRAAVDELMGSRGW
jgi:hypothetical protein